MKKGLLILFLTCACFVSQAQVTIITTIAGKDTAAFSGDGGPATNAALRTPEFVRLDKSGNVYISDGGNNRIRRIDCITRNISTLAGSDMFGYNGDNILAIHAQLAIPEGICTDAAGNVYFADGANNRIRKIAVSTGIITTVAGVGPSGILVGGSGGDGGPATDAQLDDPIGVCIDRAGNIYIGDYSNNKVRRVDAVTGIITTFAGQQGPAMYSGGFVGYSGDNGLATNAVLSGPIQVFADSIGNVFICDQFNHVVRKVDIATNFITTVVGNGTVGYSGDNGPATAAQLNQPAGMFIDRQGNMFIADGYNGAIRKVDAVTGIITTVAGTGVLGFSGDNGPATNAQLRCSDVALDEYGNIYIADEDNNRIRKVYNPKLAVPNEAPQADIVKLYPNPAGNELSVIYDFTGKQDGLLQVTDMTGHFMLTGSLKAVKQKEVFNISNLPTGMYIYKVVQDSVVISSGKIIKE